METNIKLGDFLNCLNENQRCIIYYAEPEGKPELSPVLVLPTKAMYIKRNTKDIDNETVKNLAILDLPSGYRVLGIQI